MKRQISSLLMISVMLMTIAVVVSCGRDKLPPDYYKIGEDVYAIDNVRIINNGETEGGFNIDLRLYCENGKDFINFRIVSKEAERIPEGSYSLDPNNPYSRILECKNMISSIHKIIFDLPLTILMKSLVFFFQSSIFESKINSFNSEYVHCSNCLNSFVYLFFKLIITFCFSLLF